MNSDDVKYKIEVMQAYAEGKKIQWICKLTDEEWEDCPTPGFNWAKNDYRVKPEIIEKPSINWNHVSDKFNYLTVDKKGDIKAAWLYSDKPSWNGCNWAVEGTYSETEYAQMFKSLNPGNCEPQYSLICRPGFE